MVKLFYITGLVISSLFCVSQNDDTLFVNYFSQAGFAVYDDGKATGVEMGILDEYIAWLKTSKNLYVNVKYVKFSNFGGSLKNPTTVDFTPRSRTHKGSNTMSFKTFKMCKIKATNQEDKQKSNLHVINRTQ